ncbi:MAG: YqgE/AlgH family protein [Bacteroidales bacterium]|nr:YqgE/AlgH family protein [Bacteroidales bacterium]MBN2697342.1 YqgE/AlgH family protein [Bacteroidales bacterium]
MDLNIDFFHIVNDQVAEKGRILISGPFLGDNYFRRSVVYLTEHTKDGSLGFVLNKPMDMKASDVIRDFPEGDFSVSIGGPVNTNTVHYLHTLGDMIPESIFVKDGIFWGGDFEILKEMIEKDQIQRNQLRFFLGYSGWSANQLDDELKENSWLVGDIPARLVMESKGEEFWGKTLSRYRNKYKAWANFPEDPGLN